MKQFNKINNILGWITFLIANVVYFLTIEPTTSFWDCGEFIATAYKLEVGHPPGAPFFMIVARFFTLFASDVLQVAKMVNLVSALASSFTIIFLFWTVTHIAKKLFVKDGEISLHNAIAILGAGLVGSLTYTFSDTFWFSAVEGEVYALSSFFTAIVFWAILKWENVANQKYANRWIILIAYFMGLSIGVHLLNLLAIPAIVFVYYFKKYEVTKKGVLYASLVSIVSIASIMYGIIPFTVKIGSWFELLFVNGFGLPYNSGIFIYMILLFGGIIYGLYYSSKKRKVLLNTIILSFTVILIGYSSFTMIVIRSIANPPMDENNPETVFYLLSYLNREQYGDRPLMYGEYFNAPAVGNDKSSGTYIKKEGKYVESNIRDINVYDDRFKTLFPRMYDRQPAHIKEYKRWSSFKGKPVRNARNAQGEMKTINKPTFGENLQYFFTYQLGHMYFRYFMWNFAGRQNDVQGHGGILNGNWISGISFIDEARLGNQDELTELMKNEESRNEYYLLPLILGLMGLVFMASKSNKDFWVILLLFFFTGIAIVVYLNQYPLQPRERDYAYAGSYYAFTIWIGLGLLAIYSGLNEYLPKMGNSIIATLVCLLLVPGIMAKENWDDHDRSGRYTARDFAYNYLDSCEPNSVLLTFGDNDTFPLWYVQEVEGYRTDVRVMNMSLLSTDWYVNQMKRRAYDSDPVPFSMTFDKYIQGTRDQVFLMEKYKDYTNLKSVMDFVASDDPRSKINYSATMQLDYLPAKNLRVPVDKQKVIENGTVSPENAHKIVSAVDWRISKNSILKSDMMFLDFLAINDWERPIYFAVSAAPDSYLDMEDYFQLEGLAYRLVPIKTKNQDQNTIGRVNTEKMYELLVNKYTYGRMNEPDVYMDENNKRIMSIIGIRNSFARLADELLKEGKIDSAVTVLDKSFEVMPYEKLPYDHKIIPLIRAYYIAEEYEKANNLTEMLANRYFDEMEYYNSLSGKFANLVSREKSVADQVFKILQNLCDIFKQAEMKAKLEKRYIEIAGN
ncbi:MAG: DUF2723 domain-containing protein [Bacteroidetes bacterium]|jgi:hypothetical protein|nr:DUF2723 domain-containing protein [Bacteroidota bacterium]MBT6685939.1 DUF2723 domain-containing protein [Bacteroidota bacterium]MBT7143352.1 DUF2723 domain-containing protein [Bacteroidota bacterium]MBT7492947.1 DUF2723 domain-containing protein [Bacteroidota bacterium]